ncbi:troponin T, skeletal muscle-like [Paramacrobiotus metropolitanus]|uniref:troponin T, skeletal muscle-like n=1 Tax=Paramacrobiotus metropolitanus TaxID=2943436 RepID=UPI002445EECD|nr:troponin T, skeletal muscle-like [Paramacrobiotus metropolitanus]
MKCAVVYYYHSCFVCRDEEKVKARKEEPKEQKTEAQLLMEAKARKHEDEESARLREIEEQRRIQREKEDEELRRLKEKQAQRQKQREEEERALEQQKKQLEEQRKREEEDRKQKAEEDKRRKQEEAERKKAAAAAAMSGGRNFVIDKEKKGESTIDKFMNISKAKTEMGLNSNELEALKRKTISDRIKPLSVEGLDNTGLKAKAEELWKLIIQVETAKYDLEERAKRQEYDLRELNERQRQINKKKYEAAGLDAEQASSRFPPKVRIVSKHERQVDRRTFGDKRGLFDTSNKKDDKPELNKPLAKKRETWIKEKGEERQRHSYAEDLEEEPAENTYGGGGASHDEDNYGSSRYSSHQAEEEVAEEEE